LKILVTGGAGYIGSTICSALEDAGHTPVILDSLATGKIEFTLGRFFYKGDIADFNLLQSIVIDHPDVAGAIHCAALIVVPDSVSRPFEYYTENVSKSVSFFSNLHKLKINRVLFSSSASIYDISPDFLVNETSALKPSSPYARTKYMMEMVLEDFCHAYKMQGVALRYFNPIGADPMMRSGIHVKEPSHVLGKLVDVAVGKSPQFVLTGDKWPTRDGSGIRDYVHVWDLAQAHVRTFQSFDRIFEKGRTGYEVINLGTSTGVTVKELIDAFERVYGKVLPKSVAAPRPGDVAGAYANADKAFELTGWKAQLSLDQGIADALKWAKLRPQKLGYP
jgi:UDP-glucose 4-epimerase